MEHVIELKLAPGDKVTFKLQDENGRDYDECFLVRADDEPLFYRWVAWISGKPSRGSGARSFGGAILHKVN